MKSVLCKSVSIKYENLNFNQKREKDKTKF